MKTLTETKALHDLQKLKTDYQNFIKDRYEHNAQSCETCLTKGACCLDTHFVNVHITRLEAVLISVAQHPAQSDRRRVVGAGH